MRKINIFNSKILVFLIFFLTSCGIYKPVDVREVPVNAKERIKKNMEEGKGIQLFNKDEFGVGSFSEFNPLWRASLDTLDFMILSSADYGGGIIITDWYSENNDDEAIKITVRFHSNEIRADGLDIIIHNKVCDENNKCNVSKVDGELNNEIKIAILKKAVTYDKDFQARVKKQRKKKRPTSPIKQNMKKKIRFS